MTPTTVAETQTVGKEEAAALLDLSPRRVLEYAQAGALRAQKLRDPVTKLWQVRLNLGDVMSLAEERKQPRPHRKPQSAALPAATAAEPVPQIAAPSAPVAEALEIRPFDNMPGSVRLNVRESAAYLRMPRTFVLSLLEGEALQGIKLPNGSWRIKKADLDLLP